MPPVMSEENIIIDSLTNGTDHWDDDVEIFVMDPGPHQEFGWQDGDEDDGVEEEPCHSQANQQRDYDLITNFQLDILYIGVIEV